MYICLYYKIEELIPKKIYVSTPDFWNIFDDRVLLIIDLLREDYGPMEINNWCFDGDRHFCGFRPFEINIGSYLSQHKFGRAFDLYPKKSKVEDIRRDIISQKKSYMEDIKGLELDVPWLHIDTRNSKDLICFNQGN